MTMTKQDKIDILNAIEVVDSEGGDSCYVSIANDANNLEILHSVGLTESDYYVQDDETIDILNAALTCGAVYWTGKKFVVDRKHDAIVDLKEKLNEYWDNINYGEAIGSELLSDILFQSNELIEAVEDPDYLITIKAQEEEIERLKAELKDASRSRRDL